MSAIRLLVLRRLREQPLRAIMAAIVVGAGVALMVAVLIVISSLDASVRAAGRAFWGPAPLRVIGASARGGLVPAQVDKVATTPGVAAAVPVVQAISLAETGEGRQVPVVALGFDCRVEALVGPFGCTPEMLAPRMRGAPTFIAGALAGQLGPEAMLRTNAGRLPLAGVPVLPGLNALNDGRAVGFRLDEARSAMVRGPNVDVIYVVPAPDTDLATLAERLRTAVGPAAGVLRADDTPPVLGFIKVAFIPLFSVVALLTLGVGAILVRNTVTLSLEERRRQLAIVGALGGSRRVLVGSPLLEAGLLGFVGGLLGVLTGTAVAIPIVRSLSDFTIRTAGLGLHVSVTAVAVIGSVVLGVGVALTAAIGPARRTARLDVAAELSSRGRREETQAATSWTRVTARFVLLILGVGLCFLARHDGALEPWQAVLAAPAFLLTVVAAAGLMAALAPRLLAVGSAVLGRRSGSVRLALANLQREPHRTGAMAVASGFAVGTAFMIGSYAVATRQGITENITHNLHGVEISTLDPGNNGNVDSRVPAGVLKAVAAVPGVASVERVAFVLSGHREGDLIAVDAYEGNPSQFAVIRGSVAQARFDAGEVTIGAALARQTGARPGDKVNLETPGGLVSLPVMAIDENGDGGGRNISMTYALMEKLYGPQPAIWAVAKPVPGLSSADLAERIRRAQLDPGLHIRLPSEVASKLAEQVSKQLASFWTLQRALLVMSFVAVLSTLLLVGVQRRRELAMLAAVGMPPGDLSRMIFAEAGLVSLAGIIVGTLFAVAMYEALLLITPVLVGFSQPFAVDLGTTLFWAGVGMGVAMAAASLPAWRTSRVEILDALRYE